VWNAWQKTTPYTFQHNGFVERMKEKLIEKPKSMINGVGLSHELFADAMDTTYYLVNHSNTSTLVDKTLYEPWTSKKPSIKHLKVFGCDAYMHVPRENRSMLDHKAEKCIVIAYKDGIRRL
jgi:hypothetical protein